jgi:transcription termination factor Rho
MLTVPEVLNMSDAAMPTTPPADTATAENGAPAPAEATPRRRTRRAASPEPAAAGAGEAAPASEEAAAPPRKRATRRTAASAEANAEAGDKSAADGQEAAPRPKRGRPAKSAAAQAEATETAPAPTAAPVAPPATAPPTADTPPSAAEAPVDARSQTSASGAPVGAAPQEEARGENRNDSPEGQLSLLERPVAPEQPAAREESGAANGQPALGEGRGEARFAPRGEPRERFPSEGRTDNRPAGTGGENRPEGRPLEGRGGRFRPRADEPRREGFRPSPNNFAGAPAFNGPNAPSTSSGPAWREEFGPNGTRLAPRDAERAEAEARGPENRGPENRGPAPREVEAPEARGPEPRVPDFRGPEGRDNRPNDGRGNDGRGNDGRGRGDNRQDNRPDFRDNREPREPREHRNDGRNDNRDNRFGRDRNGRDGNRDGGRNDNRNERNNDRNNERNMGGLDRIERDAMRAAPEVGMAALEALSLEELRAAVLNFGEANAPEMGRDELVFRGLELQAQAAGMAFKRGLLETLSDGRGFLRTEGYKSSDNDVYVSSSQIKRFNLKTGDIVSGQVRPPKGDERHFGMLRVEAINGASPEEMKTRKEFEKLTAIFPDEKWKLETAQENITARIIDLVSPIGKGQRGLIVAPPKAGKTTLIKNIANSLSRNHPEAELIVLLIDERPEEVTDISRSVRGEVVASTFDETAENHMRVAEMVMEKAKRMVEQKKDVVILLDSITRLSRASNLVVTPSGRTMSGGLDPAAMHKPKKMLGARPQHRRGRLADDSGDGPGRHG